jgi:hypothetical protein
MFGHLADWQTVCSRWSFTIRSSFEYSSPCGTFIFNHDGLRPTVDDAAGVSEITLSGRGIRLFNRRARQSNDAAEF